MAAVSTSAGGGGNPFGTIPQPIAMPSSLWQQVVGAVPGAGNLAGPVANAIGTEVSGQLNSNTVKQLEDKAAAYGVNSGMPGMTPGSLALNNLMASMGMTSEGLTQRGIGDYSNFLGTLAGTMTNPATTADVGEWNSIVQSAPDPAAAAGYQLSLLNRYAQMMGGPAGGTGSFAPTTNGPWWASNPLLALGPGTTESGPNTYHTPAPA